MRGIVLASHGLLAEGMLDTIKMLSGEPEQITSLCLVPEQGLDDYSEKLMEAVKRVDQGHGVVIFCDLLFGTPCNCSARFLKDAIDDNVIIVTGMNLPMVLEYVTSRADMADIDSIVKTGQEGIVDFNKIYQRD